MSSRIDAIVVPGAGPFYDRLAAARDIQDSDDLASVAAELLRAIHSAMADAGHAGAAALPLCEEPGVRAIADKIASLCLVQNVPFRSALCPHLALKRALDRRVG